MGNRSVMPLDVRGCTRATLKASACALSVPCLKRLGNPLNRLRAWDRDLQLSPLNEEFPVGASHQLASITSLPPTPHTTTTTTTTTIIIITIIIIIIIITH